MTTLEARGFDPAHSLLLTDLYQLNMVDSYLRGGLTGTAVFEFFVRRLPPGRNFLLAAGLDQALAFLEDARLTDAEADWLRAGGRFPPALVDFLAGFRFTGDVDAMAEGTPFFPHEPILRVTAPLPQAQLVETRLVNLLQFQTLVASKAVRMVLAAPGRRLVDFGLRRAHGGEAGLLAARAAYLAGFAGTATVPAEPLFGVPVFGTMAHSFVLAHDSETAAFAAFARDHPDQTVFLIDTYDTERGAEAVVALAPRLRAAGIGVRGVRLDSGDLADHAVKVRTILDTGGLLQARIFASGGIDEHLLARLHAAAAPIDAYGVGTSLVTSEDAPALDCAYKLQAYAGRPRRKRSEGKATWPGAKQVYRFHGGDGSCTHDLVTTADDPPPPGGTPLLAPALRGGRRVPDLPDLAASRTHAAAVGRLPESLRRLDPAPPYGVDISPALCLLAHEADGAADRAGG
ncbi:MAG: nicotinate phosphoribosyltransferase [Hyphomicrobiales bacterium]|nr:nicotinate phosphoribosyltransferase [Hyphomicrobiales bacterium]